MTGLGVLFEEEDPAAAQHWYQRAADAGYTEAMYHLAVVPTDEDPTTDDAQVNLARPAH
jgi:TPR repeat protein